MSTLAYSPLVEEIIQEVTKLPPEFQQKVLDYTHLLSPKGVPGKQLLRFAGIIQPDDIQLMKEAIEDSCEMIDEDEW